MPQTPPDGPLDVSKLPFIDIVIAYSVMNLNWMLAQLSLLIF